MKKTNIIGRARIATLVIFLCFFSSNLFSTAIATWNLTGANNPNGAVSAPVSTNDVNLTVSDLTKNMGMGDSNGSFPNSIHGTGVTATSLAEAINNNEYIEFTITPATGKSVSITSIDISAMSQGRAATCTLLSSLAGFAAGYPVSSITLGIGNEVNISNQTLTVSGHDNLTSPVTFRFYFHAVTNRNYYAFGIGQRHTGTATADLRVNGSVDSTTITSWDFIGQGGQASVARKSAVAGITVSNTSFGSSLTAQEYLLNGFTARAQNALTLTDAISFGEYIEFTITPHAGKKMTIKSISLRCISQGGTRTFSLLSSVNGFGAGNEIGNVTGNLESNASLQSIPVTGHNNMSTAVTFRIYIYGLNNDWICTGIGNRLNGLSEDDLIVEGIVSNMPPIRSTATGGNWTEGSTWVGGIAPVVSDNVEIATTNGASVTVNAAVSCINLTVNSGSILSNTSNYTMTVSGDVSVTGTLTAGSGVYTLSGANKMLEGIISIYSMAITGTYTNNGTLTVNTLAGSGTLTQGAGGVLNIDGTSDITGLIATAAGNIVHYTKAGAQTPKVIAYHNLSLSGGGTKTLGAISTVAGNITLSGSTTTATLGAALTVGGFVSLGTGTKLLLGNFTSSSNVLVFDNIIQPLGSHGSTASTATYKNSTYFGADATGILNVDFMPTIKVTATGGTSTAYYAELTSAFSAINAGTHSGSISVNVLSNCTLTASAVLYQSGYNGGGGISSYTAIHIFPTYTGLTISTNINAPLIDLNGADNVVIDGRLNGAGTTKDLTITNTSTGTSASTIRFVNDACTNSVKYSNIKGSTTNTTGGIIHFSTTSATIGNDNNRIEFNNITNAANANRPINTLYSAGTASKTNSGNFINSNNIYDFLNNGANSNGISLDTNTTDFTISNNTFYETASFTSTADISYSVIKVNNTSGFFNITGNFIGGNAADKTGTWTKSGFNTPFVAINLSAGTTTASTVENNTIRSINWSNSEAATFTAMQVLAGNINIGSNGNPNTIGATTGNSSIVVTSGVSGAIIYGIKIESENTVNCSYNTIGAINATTSNSTHGSSIYAIYKCNCGGTISINYNLIGSENTSNSIYCSSPSTGAGSVQELIGIYNRGSGLTSIGNNILANLTNGSTNTFTSTQGFINGIRSTNGTTTISNNWIYGLKISNAFIDSSGDKYSVIGIMQTQGWNGTLVQTNTGNTVCNLTNDFISYNDQILGIYLTGGVAGTPARSLVNRNFISGLNISGSSSGSNSKAIGLYTYGQVDIFNNIISLEGSPTANVYGVAENQNNSHAMNFHFNTLYIGGTTTVADRNSRAYFNSNYNLTTTHSYKNNLMVNNRTNTGTANGSNNCMGFPFGGLNFVLDYNVYFVSSASSSFGYHGDAANKNVNDMAIWRIVTGQEAHSIVIDPLFVNAGGSIASDYMIQRNLIGETNADVLSDFGNSVSRLVPNVGAWERDINLWTGAVNGAYSNSANWSKGLIPTAGDNLVFCASPSNDCTLDTDATVANLIIESTKGIVIPTSKLLTVNNKIITDNNTSRIYIQASNDGTAPNGSLIFHNDALSPVYATVEMYDKASIVNPDSSKTNANNYRWQYFGIPVSQLRAQPTFDGSYVRRWNNPNSKWVIQRNDSVILPFIGYEIAQPAPKKIFFAGKLVNSNFSTTLNYNDTIPNPGQYIFSNPYTAAIDITQLAYGAGIDNAVYLFNAGSSSDWLLNGVSYDNSALPGQYVVCPKANAGTGLIPGEIASMQGFMVKDEIGGVDNTFGIPYSAVVKNSTVQRVSKQSNNSSNSATGDKVMTTIDVKGTNLADRMWLFTDPTCTRGFDNGWDGRKMLGSALAPQLFAREADGDYQINCVNNIHSTTLAFRAGMDTDYTIKFTHQNITDTYSAIYLMDLIEGITTDISQSGSEYSFSTTSVPYPEVRFRIVATNNEITENANLKENGIKIIASENNIIVHNFDAFDGLITVYDLNGKIVQNAKINGIGITTLTTNLTDGYYIVKAKTEKREAIEKIILNKVAK